MACYDASRPDADRSDWVGGADYPHYPRGSTPMRRADADRNLLFGILALQMDFITRDALIAAMNSWVLDKQKPLGQILLDQGALACEAHCALEIFIQQH